MLHLEQSKWFFLKNAKKNVLGIGHRKNGTDKPTERKRELPVPEFSKRARR